MESPPPLEAIRRRVTDIFEQTRDEKIDPSRPLIAEQGLDSLDMIEIGFELEECFDFEFSSRNALDELDRALGGSRVVNEGVLTELGERLLQERMPELASVDMPRPVRVAELPKYFTIETFVRLVYDFYQAVPDRSPAGDERVVCDGFRLVGESSGEAVSPPRGDDLLDAWVQSKQEELAAKSGP